MCCVVRTSPLVVGEEEDILGLGIACGLEDVGSQGLRGEVAARVLQQLARQEVIARLGRRGGVRLRGGKRRGVR